MDDFLFLSFSSSALALADSLEGVEAGVESTDEASGKAPGTALTGVDEGVSPLMEAGGVDWATTGVAVGSTTVEGKGVEAVSRGATRDSAGLRGEAEVGSAGVGAEAIGTSAWTGVGMTSATRDSGREVDATVGVDSTTTGFSTCSNFSSEGLGTTTAGSSASLRGAGTCSKSA